MFPDFLFQDTIPASGDMLDAELIILNRLRVRSETLSMPFVVFSPRPFVSFSWNASGIRSTIGTLPK